MGISSSMFFRACAYLGSNHDIRLFSDLEPLCPEGFVVRSWESNEGRSENFQYIDSRQEASCLDCSFPKISS